VKGIQIIRPIPAQIAAGGSGVANLLTPSPREVWIAPGVGAQAIDIDLSSAQAVDAFYLGFTSARADALWTIQSIAAMGAVATATHVNAQPLRLAGNIRDRFPAFARLPDPVVGRYFRVIVNQPVVAIEIGNLVVGLALEWPYAYGSGRQPIDASRVVDLPDGGYGVDASVVKASLQWRFVDLDDEALDKLWAIAEDRGEHRPLVIVEGPTSPPKATSVHYGLFRRFESFEREDAAATKWSLTVAEWR
jgi:hypothetical protein